MQVVAFDLLRCVVLRFSRSIGLAPGDPTMTCSRCHADNLFERELQFDRDDTPAQRLTKLEAGLARHPPAPPEALSLWAAFLSLPLDDRGLSLTLTPQRQKEKTFEAIAAFLLTLAAEQPLLLTIEDLHWADPSTLGFIDLVLGQVPATAILLIMTARPEFRPPWTPHGHLTSLTVNRMTRRQTELMIERVTGGKALPTAVLQQMVAKTDGVPLFVEELTTGAVTTSSSTRCLRWRFPPRSRTR
jgi:predicted ATPase